MSKLKILDLFSGIGGFSLGLERTGGFETVAFCEIDPFCQKVLKKHWPTVPCFSDVRELKYDGQVDVVTGGFPCQDISTSGRKAGMSTATRSGLWSEIIRISSELRPSYVIVENVANLLTGPAGKSGAWFGRVLGDLAEIGYDAEWHCISAAFIGARHERDRVWLIANPTSQRQPLKGGYIDALRATPQTYWEADSIINHVQGTGLPWVCGKHDGLPYIMDGLTALGNSVMPGIAEIIGHAILTAEAHNA